MTESTRVPSKSHRLRSPNSALMERMQTRHAPELDLASPCRVQTSKTTINCRTPSRLFGDRTFSSSASIHGMSAAATLIRFETGARWSTAHSRTWLMTLQFRGQLSAPFPAENWSSTSTTMIISRSFRMSGGCGRDCPSPWAYGMRRRGTLSAILRR